MTTQQPDSGRHRFDPQQEAKKLRERLARKDLIVEMQFSRRQGQILKEARRSKGWSQKKLATHFGVSPSKLGRMEKGACGIPCNLIYQAWIYFGPIFRTRIERITLELNCFIADELSRRLIIH